MSSRHLTDKDRGEEALYIVSLYNVQIFSIAPYIHTSILGNSIGIRYTIPNYIGQKERRLQMHFNTLQCHVIFIASTVNA